MANRKNTLIGGLLVLAFVISPAYSFAREEEANDDSTIRANASLKASTSVKLDRLQDRKEDREEQKDLLRTRIELKSSTTASTTLKQRLEERREDRIEKIRENGDDRLSKLREDIEKRIEKHAEWMIQRFNAAVERLEKLSVRIESRIAKLKAEGKNVTEAEKLVASAKIEIGQAIDGIAKIEVAFETALSAENLRGAFNEVRILADAVREDLIAAHKALMSTLPLIKSLSTENSVNASTTIQTVQ